MDITSFTELSPGTLALLITCLVVALGFEFVNGFHDTANAVATVIYTKTLKPWTAVTLSGVMNFLGVFVGGIGVAMAIVHLLPVELLVSSGVGEGLAMVISLLLSAVLWNLGTWFFGIPASSSHTLIGAILGVGLANSAMHGHPGEGVSWHAASHVGAALLVSPLLGFGLSWVMVRAMRAVVKDPRAFHAPEGDEPPPAWIRALLVLTCGGVSFTHGSNDGQKGVGLLMLILVGLVPAGFALDANASAATLRRAEAAAVAMQEDVAPLAAGCAEGASAPICVVHREAGRIAATLDGHGAVGDIPSAERWPVRESILRIDDALTRMEEAPRTTPPAVRQTLAAERAHLDPLTDYAPWWVVAAVALALGVGTMIGWKRIVVTVGEKIGKTHLTYAQGASAELVAMATIGMSSLFGLPVSTTHVLSSGVAGTMAAEGSGLQRSTVRNILLAWVLTLPASMALSAGLFALLATLLG